MVAVQTGVPEGTVIQHDRNLSLVGLRTMGGRGRAAARVTYEDAANLIIAVAGSRSVKDSAATVHQYKDLPTFTPLGFNDDGKDVVSGRTFGDAIAVLLEMVSESRDAYKDPAVNGVQVQMYGPNPRARIVLTIEGFDRTIDYDGRGTRGIGKTPPTPFADLQFIAEFSQITLGFVGELVRG